MFVIKFEHFSLIVCCRQFTLRCEYKYRDKLVRIVVMLQLYGFSHETFVPECSTATAFCVKSEQLDLWAAPEDCWYSCKWIVIRSHQNSTVDYVFSLLNFTTVNSILSCMASVLSRSNALYSWKDQSLVSADFSKRLNCKTHTDASGPTVARKLSIAFWLFEVNKRKWYCGQTCTSNKRGKNLLFFSMMTSQNIMTDILSFIQKIFRKALNIKKRHFIQPYVSATKASQQEYFIHLKPKIERQKALHRTQWVLLEVTDASLVGQVFQGRVLQKLGKTPSYHPENPQSNSLVSVQVCQMEQLLWKSGRNISNSAVQLFC